VEHIKRIKELKLKNLNKKLWHIQNEKHPKQGETREELITKQLLLSWLLAQLLAKLICITERIGLKENFIIRVKL
jgi:hypothetical protein